MSQPVLKAHNMEIVIEAMDSHRNGVSGEGFYVLNFTADMPDYPEPVPFMGVVFPPDPDWDDEGHEEFTCYRRGSWDNPRVAVFRRDLLPEIAFFKNSWRGDHFAPALYEAILRYRENDYKFPFPEVEPATVPAEKAWWQVTP